MNRENLHKANEINKEIKELESFIGVAEKVWTGKLIERKTIFKSNPYGIFGSEEFEMNTEIKNKVLNVLREYLNDLNKQLNSL